MLKTFDVIVTHMLFKVNNTLQINYNTVVVVV